MSLSIIQNYTGDGDPSLLIPKIGTSYQENPQLKEIVDLIKHWQFKTALDELEQCIREDRERVNALLLKGELLAHFELNKESAEAYREVLRIEKDHTVAEFLLLGQLTSLSDEGEEKSYLLQSIKRKSPRLYEEYMYVVELIEENKKCFEFSEGDAALELICVCGYVLNKDGTIPLILKNRLDKALELALENPSAILLLSGGAVQNKYNEAYEMKRYLVERGIEEDRLVALDKAKDTVGNIIEFTEYIQSGHFDSICIVTSKVHLPRSWMALKIGLDQMSYQTSLAGSAPDEPVPEEMMAIEHKLNYQTLFRVAGLFEKKDVEEKL